MGTYNMFQSTKVYGDQTSIAPRLPFKSEILKNDFIFRRVHNNNLLLQIG